MRKFLIFLLCLCVMLMTFAVPSGSVSANEITISGIDDFIEFAENCRIDSYSRNLSVKLTSDIDFTGLEFIPVPVFCGSFDGDGHTISGISMTKDGSVQGVFRYITDTAIVKDLNVSADIAPQGSKASIGGIAGNNSGRIENCTFRGSVAGSDYIGGITGINTVSGIINNCRTDGMVQGSHFVGGIAGENKGLISNCRNYATVNNTVQQNSVSISEITIDSMTSTEYAAAVTDAGGIAGTNEGSLRLCDNHADIGYKHIGYNIGGIAGSSVGYIYKCTNTGNISGRKDVGGIAGQMEPSVLIEYSADTLQILEGQLDTMQYLTNSAVANAQESTGEIGNQLEILQGQSQSAQAALNILLDNMKNPDNMNFDAIQAAYNSFNNSLDDMGETMQTIGLIAGNSVNELGDDFQQVSAQMNAIGTTIENASETTGINIQDVSDKDTERDISAKTADCNNMGAVLADLNAGGIVGTISVENNLDHESDIDFAGSQSLNFDTKYRAVVVDCENSGNVTIKRSNAGGVAGFMSLGLAKNCTNTGSVGSAGAKYVGGIVGSSDGYVRKCSAKCIVEGTSYAGGVAGKAEIITDCRSITELHGGKEKIGAVIGYSQDRTEVYGNYYKAIGEDIGAIDGISYLGKAQALENDKFFALDGIESLFENVTISFVFEDGTIKSVTVRSGESIGIDSVPSIPQKEGYDASWRDLSEDKLENIEFDAVYYAVYSQQSTVIQSGQTRSNGLPITLIQGTFGGGEGIYLTEITEEVSVSDKQAVIEAWSYSLDNGSKGSVVRFLPEDAHAAKDIDVFVGSEGKWRKTEFCIEGSYVVFAVSEDDTAFCIAEALPDYSSIIRIGISAVCVLVLIVIIICRIIAAKKKAHREEKQET